MYLASVLSGTTSLPTFSCSGDDTGSEKHRSFSCSSAEQLVQSLNSPLAHGSCWLWWQGFLSNNDSSVGYNFTPQASHCGSEPVLLHFGSRALGIPSGNTGCLSAITLINLLSSVAPILCLNSASSLLVKSSWFSTSVGVLTLATGRLGNQFLNQTQDDKQGHLGSSVTWQAWADDNQFFTHVGFILFCYKAWMHTT